MIPSRTISGRGETERNIGEEGEIKRERERESGVAIPATRNTQ